jgi:uncharacterized protein HemX
MPENPSSAPSAPAPAPGVPAPELPAAAPAPRSGRPLRFALLLAVAVLALGSAIGLWMLRGEVRALGQQLEQSRAALTAADELSAQRDREAQLRIERLETDLARLHEQRGELDQLYADLTRGRDDLALIEVERLVMLAAQELQSGTGLPAALAAMQGADARLARIGGPQVIALRRAIARDLERLRAAPTVDITGTALKLDQLAQSVDGLPLLAEAAARPASATRKAAGAAAPAARETSDSAWTRVRAWLGQEFGDLIRIREVDTPEALLLNGPQQQLVRHQLRLRLLDARQTLLMRSDRLYRADLAEAQALLSRYFDLRAPAAAAAQSQLKQLAGLPLSVDLPQVSDSLAALRSLRQGGR